MGGVRFSSVSERRAVALLVRSWNVFHGNALPPRRRGFLREMIELVCSDSPDVVCLQEVPVWGIARLEEWSSMQALAVVARAPRIPGRAGARVTRWNQGFFRSAFVGQANAILVSRSLQPRNGDTCRSAIPDASAASCRPSASPGAIWWPICTRTAVSRWRGVELERARAFAEAALAAGEVVVLAGDFNLSDFELAGYSTATDGIDHVLVQGAAASAPLVWPLERRELDGVVLSDHAPVEVIIR